MKKILLYFLISIMVVVGFAGYVLRWIIKPLKALSHLMMLEKYTAWQEIKSGWLTWDIDVRDEFK